VESEFHTPVKYDGKDISLASIPYGGGLNTFSFTRLSNNPVLPTNNFPPFIAFVVSISPARRTLPPPSPPAAYAGCCPFSWSARSSATEEVVLVRVFRNDFRLDDDDDDGDDVGCVAVVGGVSST